MRCVVSITIARQTSKTLLALFIFGSSCAQGWAQTETILHQFEGFNLDGNAPNGALVEGGSGTFYGTTTYGGSSSACQGSYIGCGTVFEIAATKAGSWVETVLYSFQPGNGDGAWPYGGVILDKNGNLYGTTDAGGANDAGAVFELMPPQVSGGSWTESILYSFGANNNDGRTPLAGLAIDSLGNLYGTTPYGGANKSKACASDGCGAVFELTPPSGSGAWVETILHNFGGQDGLDPYSPVVFDNQGDLLGTTLYSGAYNCGSCGIVYLLKRPAISGDPWQEIVLHRFVGGADGSRPFSALTIEGDTAYGTTSQGGTDNRGVVYQIKRANGSWQESVVYSFGTGTDGGDPTGSLIFLGGSLYGTTGGGGLYGNGTVFQLTPSGTSWNEAILYSFGSAPDGAFPDGGVVYQNGSLYGTTESGGLIGAGTAFRISP